MAVLVGGVGAQVVDLPGVGVVGGIGHGELNALDGVAGDGVQLIDGQTGFLMVLKGHVPVLIGIEGHRLGGGVLEVGGRDGLLGHLIHAGEHIVDGYFALFVCGDLRDGGAVRGLDQEGGAGDGFIGVSVGLVDGQVGAAVIFQLHGGCLAHLQLHMMLGGVEDIVGQRGGLTDGQHSGLQSLQGDFAVRVGGLVHIAGAVLHIGDAVGHAFQGLAVRAMLGQLKPGQPSVGEHELPCLVAVQMDEPLGLVHHIAGALQLHHLVAAHGELGEVDGAVSPGGQLHGAVITLDGAEAELGVGDGLGEVGGVYLDQMEAGKPLVEEGQLPHPIPGVKLHLLGGGDEDVGVVAGVGLRGLVGAGVNVGQQDLALGVGTVLAQGNGVLEHLKDHAAHGLTALAVKLGDFQGGLFLVHQ